MNRAMKIISSKWVVPVSRPVIKDGSLVVANGRITDIGYRQDILSRYPGLTEDRYSSALLPGLVNAHMHLELSHLQDVSPPLPHQCFTDWITQLLALRSENRVSPEQRIVTISSVLADMHASGVLLVADTGNEFIDVLDHPGAENWPKIMRMIEYLGPNCEASQLAQQKISVLDDRVSVIGHAPYSTEPELLQYIKSRCRRLRQLFSIHTAESNGELLFLRSATGVFREFLEKKNRWDGSFPFKERGFGGTIEYYEHLDLLDRNTLLVHCVHISEQELSLVKERGAHICLCPGSNRFLNVGVAPVDNMINAGLLPALGTDSPASNEEIDLWREMQLLAADHQDIDHGKIFAMATLGGAQSLQAEGEYGSLERGKSSQCIHVESDSLMQCQNTEELMKELVVGGRPTKISWV